MLSVIIPARNSFRDLQVLMGELVPASVKGLVRQVLVADPEAGDRTPDLCEDSGAVLVRGGLAEAAAQARAERLLLLPPQIRLGRDWIRSLADHVGRSDAPALIVGEPERAGLFAALGPRSFGLLAPVEAVISLGSRADLAAVRRKLGRKAVRLR